jgi:hypothetical protein
LFEPDWEGKDSRKNIRCSGRKRISVLENVLSAHNEQYNHGLKFLSGKETVISLYPNNLEWILRSCLLQWLPEPSIQLCNDLIITRTCPLADTFDPTITGEDITRTCPLADTFDPTITGEEPIHETHRTSVLHVRDSNQTGAFESPFLIKWFYWFDKTTYCLVQFWCSCGNKAWTA